MASAGFRCETLYRGEKTTFHFESNSHTSCFFILQALLFSRICYIIEML